MSSDAVVISARDLGKSYTIDHLKARPTSLREALRHRLRHPFGKGRRERESFWALKDVSFDVRRGEVLGIIGRNGAGKSTLLKLLSRITAPTTGSIDIVGRVASLLEVGTGFHPELTGRENVYLNGSILGMRRREIDRKFDEIVEFAEVEKFLDTPVKRYSSGMYVRLAFAVAAHLDPEVLIVDEVLSVGDATFQRKSLGKIRDVTSGGERTVLIVSHNLTTIHSLCDRVIWIKSGKVFLDGPVGPAIEQYLSEDLGRTENVFDVEDAERAHVKETALRLRRLTLNDGREVRHGEPLTVDLEYRTERNCDGVAFGAFFSNIEGGRVMCVDSDVPTSERFDIAAHTQGKITLRAHENLLQPGRYILGAVARSADNSLIDYVPSFTQIEVHAGPSTPPILVGRANEQLSVRYPVEARHENRPIDSPCGEVTDKDMTAFAHTWPAARATHDAGNGRHAAGPSPTQERPAPC